MLHHIAHHYPHLIIPFSVRLSVCAIMIVHHHHQKNNVKESRPSPASNKSPIHLNHSPIFNV